MCERPTQSPRRGRLRLILFAGGLGLGLIGLAATLEYALHPAPRIVWNASASAPIGFWRIDPDGPFHRGDMVLAHTPDSVRLLAAERYYIPANVPLLKRIAAQGGDEICALGHGIFINGTRAATRLSADRRGRRLPWWHGCRVLGNGQVLLLMDAPDSFDGRYFGSVDQHALIGKAAALWLR